MKREIFQEIEIPENVNVVLEGKKLVVKGPDGENQRHFNLRGIELKKEDLKLEKDGTPGAKVHDAINKLLDNMEPGINIY